MEKWIEIDGIKMRYDQTGDGSQPVIVMHGWGCKADTMAIPAEGAASQATTVYNLDLPGFGQSDEPDDVWGVKQYTCFIEKFCQKLGITRPVLMGHSFGGRISILMASRTPVNKVILIDAAGIKPRRSFRYYAKVYSFKTAKHLLNFFLGKAKAEPIINRMRGKAGSADYANASPRMRQILSKVVNEDLTDRLHLIKAPTLLIWGEKDTATPMRDAKIMAKKIPDSGLVSYPEADHYSFLRRPAQTKAVIASFLKS